MGIDIYSRHRMLETAGGPVSVWEAGQEDAPPVLLLHGAMVDEARLIWHHLAPYLAKSRRVLAVDFPRHGQSRPWAGRVDRACLNRVVGDMIRQLDLPPLPLIGLSMGGGVAIGFALENPGLVTGAVLMGPGGLGDRVSNQFLSWVFVKTPGMLTALTKYYAGLSPAKMRRSLAAVLHDREKTTDFDDLVEIACAEAKQKWQHKEKSMDDWQLEGLAPFRLKVNYLPELHRLACPTLWLRGENDPLIRQRDMEEAAALAPGGKLLVIRDAGHLLPLEQPDEVNRAVAEFLMSNNI